MSKLLDYPLSEAKATLVKGEQSQSAIVNQEAKDSIVNTISVDEVKELDKKADSKQDTDINELKEEVSKKATIHEFDEGAILTDAILSKIKSGDIVKVLQMEFVVNNKINQSPRSITGKMVGAVTDNSVSVVSLDWEKGQQLEPTLKIISSGTKLYKHTIPLSDESELIIVSSYPTEITEEQLIVEIYELGDIISAVAYNGTEQEYGTVISIKAGGFSYYSANTEAHETLSFPDEISDTVTAL